MSLLEPGDRVAFDHNFAGLLAIEADSVEGRAPDARLGTVQAVANEPGTWFEVLLDGDSEPLVLTKDELVKVV